MCYDLSKPPGTYLKVLSFVTNEWVLGRLKRWYEINDKDCYVELSIKTWEEVHNIREIVSYKPYKKDEKPWPSRPESQSVLFEAVGKSRKNSRRNK
jgi:hypothetical protein